MKPDVLVAAANAVLLEDMDEGYVTILVGVAEKEDPDTGVVTGEIVGITQHRDEEARRNRVEKAKEQIRNRAETTKPVPVGLTIIEENVGTKKPFLRVQVRPTHVPHHTHDGKRVTRYEASTRAIEDGELLDLYLLREAHEFERRFRAVATLIESQLFAVGEDVERLSGEVEQRLEHLRELGWQASNEAENSNALADEILAVVSSLAARHDLEDAVGALMHEIHRGAEGTWASVKERRSQIWFGFSFIAARKADSPTWQRLSARFRDFLGSEFTLDEYFQNRAELEAWDQELRDGDPKKWSAARWDAAIRAVQQARHAPLPPRVDVEEDEDLRSLFEN